MTVNVLVWVLFSMAVVFGIGTIARKIAARRLRRRARFSCIPAASKDDSVCQNQVRSRLEDAILKNLDRNSNR